MPRNMRHITCDMVRELINSNPNAHLDNHWIEQRLLRVYPVAFARELLEYETKPDPLMEFSRDFGGWVGRAFSGHLVKTNNGPDGDGKIETLNLAGDPIFNQEWEKVNPGTPLPPTVCA